MVDSSSVHPNISGCDWSHTFLSGNSPVTRSQSFSEIPPIVDEKIVSHYQ